VVPFNHWSFSMSIRTLLPRVVAAAAVGISTAASAAIVPVEQTLTLFDPQGSLVYNIATDGQANASTVSYYELVALPSWTGSTKFTTFSTEPLGSPASYAIYTDTSSGIGVGNTGALVTSWTLTDLIANNAEPYLLHLLSAGQYLLQVTTSPGEFSISTQISAVPVPGAALLFVSALLGLLGISRGRKP
jgi:hypothetical protein